MLRQATDVLLARPLTRGAQLAFADLPHPPRRVTRARFLDRAWLERFPEFLDAEMLHGAARRRVLHLAELIAGRCDWSSLRSRPTLAYLVEQTGLCLRTVQRWTRRLERAGWLQVLAHGATPRYAPGRLRPDDGNEAREWLLTIPEPVVPGDSCVTPPPTPTASRPFTGAREDPPGASDRQGIEDRRFAADVPSLAPPRWPGQVREWPLGQLTQRRCERLSAAETLQRRNLALRGLSARHLRSILRPWFGSPWEPPRFRYSPLDVLYALDHLPGGAGRHEYAGRVRDPAAWLEHRMSFWLDSAGTPLPPRSAELRDEAEAARARAAIEHSRVARRPGVDPASYAAQVRAGWRRSRGAGQR